MFRASEKSERLDLNALSIMAEKTSTSIDLSQDVGRLSTKPPRYRLKTNTEATTRTTSTAGVGMERIFCNVKVLLGE